MGGAGSLAALPVASNGISVHAQAPRRLRLVPTGFVQHTLYQASRQSRGVLDLLGERAQPLREVDGPDHNQLLSMPSVDYGVLNRRTLSDSLVALNGTRLYSGCSKMLERTLKDFDSNQDRLLSMQDFLAIIQPGGLVDDLTMYDSRLPPCGCAALSTQKAS